MIDKLKDIRQIATSQELNKLKHFKAKEFVCSCCGLVQMDAAIGPKLDKLRDLVGRALIITSGYRCPEHNAKIGGAAGSYHVRGMAVDVSIKGFTSQDIYKLVAGAISLQFRGLELGHPKGMQVIHLDIREEPGIIIFYPIDKTDKIKEIKEKG